MKTLADRILEKCVECGDCLLWRGAWASEGSTPSIWFNGVSMNVRTAIWKEAGRVLPRSMAVKPTCGESECVALEHLNAVRYRKVPCTAAKIASLTKAARARSPVDMPLVEAIRASDETGKEWASRTGLSEQTISGIRRFKRWAPLSNPFSGLMR